MSRRRKKPLRKLTTDEYQWPARIARPTTEPASRVARANYISKEPTREMEPLYAHDNTPTWVRSQSMPISRNMAMASVR